MKFFKEIQEAYNKRDAYQRDYDHSVAGMGKRQSYAYQQDGGANDEGWDQPEYRAPEYTYYIRFKDTGLVYKQKGAPKSFSNKKAANAYALAMIKNNPNLQGNLLLSVDSADKPAESLEEAKYDDTNFNPRIEKTRITNLQLELPGSSPQRKQEIEKEIKEIQNQLRLWQAANTEPHVNKPIDSDDGAPYMIYTDHVQAGQFGAHTLQGAKNVGKRAVIQQQANNYVIVTNNSNEIVFVWYPKDQEGKYSVGDKYHPPNQSDWTNLSADQPRYPEGHPYAGQIMPPNIPITTDWHAQEERPKESVSESAEDLPMYGAIIHRIMVAHTDLLQKYGPEKIMRAAEDEAEWVGDVEEIGSSDVSISVKRVIQSLQEQYGVAEAQEQGIDNKYRRAAKKMIQVYNTNPEVKARVDASPEFFRAMVYETGVINNPDKLDGTTHYHKLVDELESIFNYSSEQGVAEGSGNDAWAAGYQAFHDDVTKCPYAPGSSEARQWNLGWETAQARGWGKEGVAEGTKDSAPKMGKPERKLAQGALKGAKDMSALLGLVRDKDGVLRIPKDKKKGVAEGVAETMSLEDAVKVLRQYGAQYFRTGSDRLNFYKNGKLMTVDLIWNDDSTRSVSLSQLNATTRKLKGQGIDESDENPKDVINVDVPMFIRVLEFAREDATSDVDLHKVAERLIELSADGRTVTMDDYNAVVNELKTKNIEEADMATGNQGYDNMLAVMKAVDAGQDATFNLAGEPITLEYPEARFLAGKYKAFLKAGRQEEFLKYMNDPVMFDRLMKQLRDLLDKQRNFKGSVPGERGVEGDVPKVESAPVTVKPLPQVEEGYYWCKLSKSAKLIPEGYKKTAEGYITRK